MVAVFLHEGLPWIFQGARVSDDPRQRDLQISCESWRCVETQDLKERDMTGRCDIFLRAGVNWLA